MRFCINKEQLLRALSFAGRAVAPKSPMPLLSNVKLDLNDKGLEITGSNGDITIMSSVPYMIGETAIIRNAGQGKTLVNAHILTEIVRRLDGTDVSMEVIDDAIMKIDDGRSSFKLKCANAEEYLDVDLAESGQVLDVKCADVAQMVEQSAFAASAKEQRPVLGALHLEAAGDGRLVATATDAARLARKSISIDNSSVRFHANVPAKTFVDVIHLFEDAETVRIAVDEKKVTFHFGNTIVSARLIPGDYPVGKSIIPQSFNYFLEVNAQELLSAMGRVSILSSEKNSAVKLSMREDEVEVFARSESNGSASEQIQTFSFSGERFTVSFNPVFVIDAIRALKAEDVTLCFQAEMKPFVIKNVKDDSAVELITPLSAY